MTINHTIVMYIKHKNHKIESTKETTYINHNTMASITLDYILFIKQYIVLQTYNRWKKSQDGKSLVQVWNDIFNQLHIPLQYLYQLIYHSHAVKDVQYYTLADMHELVNGMYSAPQTYVLKTFQEYVDEKINLKTVCHSDYQTFIKNMTDPEFKKNIHAKYQKEYELTALKNQIIAETMAFIHNDSSFECLNIMPYLEYKQHRSEQHKSITQNHFEDLEYKTHEMIDQFRR